MMTVWYLVVIMSSGYTSGEIVYAIPQVNQAVCVRNKREELAQPYVRKAFCKKGALPKS